MCKCPRPGRRGGGRTTDTVDAPGPGTASQQGTPHLRHWAPLAVGAEGAVAEAAVLLPGEVEASALVLHVAARHGTFWKLQRGPACVGGCGRPGKWKEAPKACAGAHQTLALPWCPNGPLWALLPWTVLRGSACGACHPSWG